jgi:hypothetical protein
MSDYVTTQPNGVQLPLDSLDQVFTYTGSNVTAITVVYQGNTYKQTFTYSGSNITNISGWVLQ